MLSYYSLHSVQDYPLLQGFKAPFTGTEIALSPSLDSAKWMCRACPLTINHLCVSPFHIFEERVAMTCRGNFRLQQNTGLDAAPYLVLILLKEINTRFVFTNCPTFSAATQIWPIVVSRSQESEIKMGIK